MTGFFDLRLSERKQQVRGEVFKQTALLAAWETK